MERDGRLSLIVGAFVLVSLLVFGGIILSLSAERGLWRAHYRLASYFDNVQGLIEGAPVRLAGKDVGTVEFVRFGSLGAAEKSVQVGLWIDQEVQDRIRDDSLASIGTIGLLGDKYVEISMGSPQGTVLRGDATLASVSPLDLEKVASRGTQAIENIAILAANANQVVESFGASMGGRGLAKALTGAADVVQEVQKGDGLLHSLIYDTYEGSGVESIEHSLVTLEGMLSAVATGNGILHTLIYESPDEQDLVMEALTAGATLNSILEKIDRAEGTIGMLVNDPTLYDDLKLLVGGAKRSLVVRSLIRLSSDGESE